MNISGIILGLYEIVDRFMRVVSLGKIHLNLSYKWIFHQAVNTYKANTLLVLLI